MTSSERISLTPLEEAFEKLPLGYGLATELMPAFDPQAGFQFLKSTLTPNLSSGLPQAFPNEGWVRNELNNFIRDEISFHPHDVLTIPDEPRFGRPRAARPHVALSKYVESCEHELVFSGFATAIARQAGTNVLDRLYSLITHPLLGNADNKKALPRELFDEVIGSKVRANERLVFAVPSFPFKDQNPFRTLGPPSHVDLGDVALLIRLHTLSVAIFQVYPMGAEWVIFTDGTAYADALRISADSALEYQSLLRQSRNELDIGKAISIVNLRDSAVCCGRDAEGGVTFDRIESFIESLLLKIFSESREGQSLDAAASLRRGMKRNMYLEDVREDLSWADWWLVLHARQTQQLPQHLRESWSDVELLANRAAAKYAAFNLTLRYLQVIERSLARTIRATVHAKVGQIAVPRLGREYPWNGIAVVEGDDVGVQTVKTRSLREMAATGRSVARFNDASGWPFYCKLES